MSFAAKVLADSANPKYQRITTVELTYPRSIHAEFMTHRMYSRNSASSRAIPIEKMLSIMSANPFLPIYWGSNKSGMQAGEEISEENIEQAKAAILLHFEQAKGLVGVLNDLGLHKQICNRYIEPWMWITVIATGNSTAFENFFHLRCSGDAEPHIQKIAYMLRDVYDASVPKALKYRAWHLPLTGFDGDERLTEGDLIRVSVARCARVSYLTHDGTRDIGADLRLHDRLKSAGHWSPFEHVASASAGSNQAGNLGPGWVQYRKKFSGEVCELAERNPQ